MKFTDYDNLDSIFDLVENDTNQVILKVNAKNPLTVARYPFIKGNWEYITVTKTDYHTLTIVYNDGTTFLLVGE